MERTYLIVPLLFVACGGPVEGAPPVEPVASEPLGPTPVVFLEVVEPYVLGPDCRELAARGDVGYVGRFRPSDRPVPADARLALVGAEPWSCEPERITPVTLEIVRGEELEVAATCTGFEADPCFRKMHVDVAVYGAFEEVKTWSYPPIFHNIRADHVDRPGVKEPLPDELTQVDSAAAGHRIVIREKSMAELWHEDQLIERFGDATFPLVDGRYYLYTGGRILSLMSADREVVFESYGASLTPPPVKDEFFN